MAPVCAHTIAKNASTARVRCAARFVRREATWLILPVVICLSQRLSHACLSISFYTVKLRMAHYNSYCPLDSPPVLDTYGNSRANTYVQTQLRGRVVLIRYRTSPGLPGLELTHSTQRIAWLCRRCVIRVSDLSASDGRVLAYRCIDG